MARQADALDELTPREREVLEHLRAGLTDAEIAQRLDISTAGASYHVSEIIGKLGVHNRYEAAAWPERPPWWASSLAPVALLWRKAGAMLPFRLSTAAAALSGGLFVAALAGIGLVVFLLMRGDGNGSERLATGPGVSPPDALSQPPAPPSLPTLEPSDSLLVYHRGPDLWVASLDGGQSVPPRAITFGSPHTSYAGYVRRPDGGIDLYYVEHLNQPTRVEVPVDVGLYRVDLSGGAPVELLRYSYSLFFSPNASVSPDGERAVYTDMDGLVLVDLTSGERRRLAENRRCISTDGNEFACDRIWEPLWSPTGEIVLAGKDIGGDLVATKVLIDPSDDGATMEDIGYEKEYSETWSPDGERLCLFSFYGSGMFETRLAVYELGTGEGKDLLAMGIFPPAGEEDRASVSGCAWSSDGRLAVGYKADAYEGGGRIYILDEDLQVVAQSTLMEKLGGVTEWLPDDSGVLFSRQGTSEAPARYAVFYLDGRMAELPLETDRVVALIP